MAVFFISAWPASIGASVTLLPSSEVPTFSDDLQWQGLAQALDESLAYLGSLPPTKRYMIHGQAISVDHFTKSILFFQRLLTKRLTASELRVQVQQHFDVYQSEGRSARKEERRMLVTGYYQPFFEGSLVRQPPFLYPLYTTPSSLILKQVKGKGKKAVGRLEQGRFVPFWTRREIERLGPLRGDELVWLKDPFEVFTLHVQGSGAIRLNDGTLRGVQFAQNNGHGYRSIGKFLVNTGRMRLEDVNMPSIGRYLREHPAERDDVLQYNDSFIFFQWSDADKVVGNLGRELTAGRSVAADQRCFPPGALAFLKSRKPQFSGTTVSGWESMERFVTVQDTGSALQGPGRVDVFWGSGDQAGLAAGLMKEEGQMYLLLLKEGASGAAQARP